MGLFFKHPKLTGAGTGKNNANFGRVHDQPYDGYAVTPADGTDLPDGPCDALYCTAGGNVAVQMVRTNAEGNVTVLATTTLLSVATGEILPIQVSRVLSTNTTATGIYALYRK